MELNKYIDHTLLKADATKQEIDKLLKEAKEYNFKSVCIQPTWIEYASQSLKGSDVLVCTVIGFPLGANTSEVKSFEAKDAVSKGAQEVDMVVNIGACKDGQWDKVQRDIEAVVEAVPQDVTVKVIIETSLLNEEEKVKVCQAAKTAEADFVKTSTGFSTGGATLEDIALMRQTVGPQMGVKASGGVSNKEEALAMIDKGATRIGASKGIQIVSGN